MEPSSLEADTRLKISPCSESINSNVTILKLMIFTLRKLTMIINYSLFQRCVPVKLPFVPLFSYIVISIYFVGSNIVP
jgi:hypothetical protein